MTLINLLYYIGLAVIYIIGGAAIALCIYDSYCDIWEYRNAKSNEDYSGPD